MAPKMITFLIVQAVVFQMVFSQVIGRFGGCGCGGGCGCSNILPVEQLVGGYPPAYLPGPNRVIYDQPTTVIQDSTVANNLANELQLLVVSNLLSSKLPLDQNMPVLPANLASLELLSGSFAGAPLSLAPSVVAPYSSCGCGGCGCNSCGLNSLGPYSFIY